MSMRKVCYGGFTYGSVREFADTYKINRTKLMHHIRSGWTIEESIRYQSACTYKELFAGTDCKGIEEYVSRNRLSFPLFMNYFNTTNDLILASVLTRDHVISRGSDLIEFRGERYRKIQGVCIAYGIKEGVVVDRIMLGEMLLDVLNDLIDVNATKVDKIREGMIVDGMPFDSVSHVAKHFDLEIMALRSRMYHGDTLQIAVDKLRGNKNKYTYNGKNYTNLSEIARDVNVSTNRLSRAYKKLGDIEKAVEKALYLTVHGKKRNVVERDDGFWSYAGIEFSNSSKMDKAFGLVSGTVHRLVYTDGMTPEQAVDYALDYKKSKEDREKKKRELDEHAKKVYDELYNAK